MKFLRLIITIPASLLRLFSEESPLLQPSSPVEMSAKEKRKFILLRELKYTYEYDTEEINMHTAPSF